jgi:hypothetical protein
LCGNMSGPHFTRWISRCGRFGLLCNPACQGQAKSLLVPTTKPRWPGSGRHGFQTHTPRERQGSWWLWPST